MEPHISWFTVLLNKLLGGPALALLNALHIKPNNPATPIPEHVAMELIAFILVAIGALYLKSRLSVERPGGFQQVCEMLLTNPLKFGIRDLLDENIPHHGGRKFIPLVGVRFGLRSGVRSFGCGSHAFLANRRKNSSAGLRTAHVCLFQLPRPSRARSWRIYKTIRGTRFISRTVAPPCRNHQHHGPDSLAHRSFVGQHVFERIDLCDLSGIIIASHDCRLGEVSGRGCGYWNFSGTDPHCIYRTAYFRDHHSDVCVHRFARDLSGHGGVGRALKRIHTA